MAWKAEEAAIVPYGLLPVDKPGGWTSHDVVDRVRRVLGMRRIGHTGTLDPMATGVLILCVGRATGLSPFLSEQDKRYWARVRFGTTTDTLDAEGEVTARTHDVPTDAGTVRRAVDRFTGQVEQIPPMYSARKVGGTRLYRLARNGQEVKREPGRVCIYRIEIERFAPPDLDLTVSCSRGTYIRVLADDLGRDLGCGGHLAALRRLAVGNVELRHCLNLNALPEIDAKSFTLRSLQDPGMALTHLPEARLSPDQTVKFVHGNPIADLHQKGIPDEGLARALDPGGRLVGLGRWSGQTLRPVRVLMQPES